MVATPSVMLPLGTAAPSFRLPSTTGETVGLADHAGRPVLVMFICNHCPYVKHVAGELARLGRDYLGRGLGIVAISSNDAEAYPADSFDRMRAEAVLRDYPFPYLYDETQEVAEAYHAACTPDFFLFDEAHRLAYRGQLDSSRPGNGKPVTGSDLRAAVDAVLAGEPVPSDQRPSIGCGIKWRASRASGRGRVLETDSTGTA